MLVYFRNYDCKANRIDGYKCGLFLILGFSGMARKFGVGFSQMARMVQKCGVGFSRMTQMAQICGVGFSQIAQMAQKFGVCFSQMVRIAQKCELSGPKPLQYF
jgi:hypothetical protein